MQSQDQLQAQLSHLLNKIACCRQHIVADSDPEGIHDLRIAVRGLRVMLSVLGPQLRELRQDWRKVADDTSRCRDLEVLLQLIDTLPSIPTDLRAKLAKQEQSARRKLTASLAQKDIPCLIQRSRSLLDQEIPLYPASRLQRRTLKLAHRFWAAIQSKLTTLTPQAPAASWHQMRLDLKRLRYLLEYCNYELSQDWKKLLPTLKQCQSALGDLHDLDLLIDISHCMLSEQRQLKMNSAQTTVDALITTARKLTLK